MSNEFFREERNALVEKGFEKAQALITRDAIDPKRFINLYGKENVERDLRYVADNEEAWNAARAKESPETIEKMKRATVLEAILHEHGELSEWFGGKVTMIKTSRFDDINRGVDSIAEFEGKDGYSFLAMAIDATASQHVGGKIAHIAAKIKGGHLASVKYFEAENLEMRGELSGIPHVIVAADQKTIDELTELWLTGKNSELGKRPIQFQILEEIEMQCTAFAAFAQRVGQDEIAEQYLKMKELITGLQSEKKQTLKDSGKRDDAMYAIREELRLLE